MIELLVAMSITSVITIVLFSLVGQSTASYAQTQRAVSKLSQARAFIQYFERELSTRLPRTPLIHEANDADGPEASDRIAFVRVISQDEQNNTTPGDLGTSVYYVAFSPDRGSAVSPKLFRKSLDPTETQSLLESPASPSFPSIDPTTDEAIVYNILDFKASPKFHDPTTGELLDWNETSPIRPSSIALTIRFLDESSAQRFTNEADWNRVATDPRDSERQLIRSFTRMISIAK
jgi:type II secretory pathway pseudopilin PulG